MSGEIFETLGRLAELIQPSWLLASFLTGIAVKTIDDVLDEEFDSYIGIPNLTHLLGRGTAAYGALMLTVACCFSLEYSAPYFLSSYAAGMFTGYRRRLPSGLFAWQESLLAVALGAWLFGFRLMFAAVFAILCVQALDDWRDLHLDRKAGTNNLVLAFGGVETTILAIVALLASLLLSASHLAQIAVAYPLVSATVGVLGRVRQDDGVSSTKRRGERLW